jgi:hypothetical protein
MEGSLDRQLYYFPKGYQIRYIKIRKARKNKMHPVRNIRLGIDKLPSSENFRFL